MKKIQVLFLFSIFILVSCSTEFRPSGEIPDLESSIDEIFMDSINGMAANIKLEFASDSCRSISALYGDNKNIFYQLIWVNKEKFSPNKCLNEYILPKYKSFKRVAKNKNNFNLFAQNDSIISVAWIEHEYVFFMTCKKDFIDIAVENSKFLKFK